MRPILSFLLLALIIDNPASAAEKPDCHRSLLRAAAENRLGFFEDAERTALSVPADSSCGDRNHVAIRALHLTRALLGQTAKSKEAAAAIQGVDPSSLSSEMGDLVRWEMARAALKGRDVSGRPDRSAMKSYLESHPAAAKAIEGRLLLAESYLGGDDPDVEEARRLAIAAAAAKPGRSRLARARLLKAGTLDEPARSAALRRLFIEMPDTVAASGTGILESDLSQSELRERAEAFFKAVDFAEYQRVLQSLWDGGDRSPELAYKLARSHLIHVRDNPRGALEMLEYARKNGAATDSEGTFLLGRAHAKLEDYPAAELCFSKYLESGATRNRMLAHYYLAWLPYDHGEYERALPEMDRFIKKYKRSDRYSYMVWFKGWSLYRMKRYADAIRVFSGMKKMGNCLVAGKAMYWGGMAWHNLGNRTEATAWMREVIDRYPLTWYSVLAAKRLRQWNGAAWPDWVTAPAAALPEPEPLWTSPGMPAGVAAAMNAVRTMAAAGEPGLAASIFRPVARRAEKSVRGVEKARLMITAYDAAEQYNALFSEASRQFGNSMGRTPTRRTGAYWMAWYPRAYRSLVSVAADRFKIPELWPYAIMRQESRYDHRQVSHTAALGVMQMIAATARIVGRDVGVPWELDTFFDPGRNVLFGTWFLSRLYREFKGQIVFASAAYNSGAPAIRKFMRANRGLPLDEMVESIPYNEGRNYCRKVAEHLIRYAAIYMEPSERMKLYDQIFPDVVDYEIGDEINY